MCARCIAGCLFALAGGLACDGEVDRDGDGGGEDDGVGEDRPDVPDTDGERLIARTIAFPGGMPVQIDWYDQELEAPCSFGLASDGRRRCIPRARPANLFYPGADCSGSGTLVVQVEPPCETGAEQFALVSEQMSCAVTTRTFRLGTPYGGRLYSRGADGSCYEVFPAPLSSYHEAEVVAPSALVAAEHAPVGAGRLRRYVDFAEDGAREHTPEFRDTELGATCTFTWASDRVERCVPDEPSTDHGYRVSTDASCSLDAMWIPACGDSTFITLLGDLNACVPTHHAYELGELLPVDAPLYAKFEGECSRIDADPDGATWRYAEVDASRMVGPEIELRGEGRVRGRWALLEGGGAVFRGWYDTSLEAMCTRQTVGDGSSLCLPDHTASVNSLNFFSDPLCSQVRTVVWTGQECADDTDIARETTLGSNQCTVHAFYEIGGPVKGDLFTFDYDPDTDISTCRAATEAERAARRDVGDPIDLGAFESALMPAVSAPRRPSDSDRR